LYTKDWVHIWFHDFIFKQIFIADNPNLLSWIQKQRIVHSGQFVSDDLVIISEINPWEKAKQRLDKRESAHHMEKRKWSKIRKLNIGYVVYFVNTGQNDASMDPYLSEQIFAFTTLSYSLVVFYRSNFWHFFLLVDFTEWILVSRYHIFFIFNFRMETIFREKW